jgi:hypothetical protein
MNGGFLVFERIMNGKNCGVSFSKPESGTGNASVDREGRPGFSSGGELGFSNGEVGGEGRGRICNLRQ